MSLKSSHQRFIKKASIPDAESLHVTCSFAPSVRESSIAGNKKNITLHHACSVERISSVYADIFKSHKMQYPERR